MTNRKDTSKERRVARLVASSWLSLRDIALHCGVGESKMREWIALPSFPKASQPTGGLKERRFEKAAVDQWLRAHQR